MDPITFADAIERQRAKQSAPDVTFYQDALKASQEFRREYDKRLGVVKHDQMPMERSADGLIKHIINERMDTKECCIDIYICLLYTSPSPRDGLLSRMPSSA